MRVLHLTPHFGGGVGRALLGLAEHADSGIEHCFVCLEKPEKLHFINAVREAGCKVLVEPSLADLIKEIDASDIVQLEWWRHPVTISYLCRLSRTPMRLVVWCHVSGLFNEVIPEPLLKVSASFVLTSACSLQSAQLADEDKQKLAVIHSNGGLESWPRASACDKKAPLAVGYMGSLNFAKLHPDYVDFLASVAIEDFKVGLIGDETNRDVLQKRAESLNKPQLLDFSGYTEHVPEALSKFNVLAYLQNPTHYGTNENALLEAMAMGIVPVVMDNPAECEIVKHGETGLIVNSMDTFSAAITWLAEHPQQRTAMGLSASKFVKSRHTKEKMRAAFAEQYALALSQPKQCVNFGRMFGEQPSDWFLSCQEDNSLFGDDGKVSRPDNPYAYYSLAESTKGSARHFHRYYPEDPKLAQWAGQLVSSC